MGESEGGERVSFGYRSIEEMTTPEIPTPKCSGEVYGYGVICRVIE